MALWKSKMNPHTGEMTIVRGESAFHVKDGVTTYANLPITDNEENDVRFAEDTDLMWTWTISASSGLITNWVQIGSASAVDWSAITNKPSSSITDIDDAVTKKHTAGADENITIDAEPSADHEASGVKVALTAGESVVFGDVCYIKSDGKLWKADASSDTTASAVAIAIATISADASGSFLIMGIGRDDTWAWTVGGLLYLSETTGAITQTAPITSGAQVQILGVATHADRILFKPELVQVEVA